MPQRKSLQSTSLHTYQAPLRDAAARCHLTTPGHSCEGDGPVWILMHIPHEQCPAHFHLPGYWLSLFHGWASSQPPEPHVDNQHDEEHGHGRQLGVRGAHVQVLGVLAVLLGQTGQVVGLGIKGCQRERGEELGLAERSPNVTSCVRVSLEQLEAQWFCGLCLPAGLQGLSCWDESHPSWAPAGLSQKHQHLPAVSQYS